MVRNRTSDALARVLNSMGPFKGKTRLTDLLERLTSSWSGGQGTFPLADGETVTIDLRDRTQRLMWGAAYEPHVRRCLVALLHPNDTFVDVGAHIGFFSLIAASRVGSSGKVFSFEANSALFQALDANAAQFVWITPTHRAVSNQSGSVAFSDPQQPGWGKLACVRKEGQIGTVESVSLDDWHKTVGYPPIRLIKIDAEGSVAGEHRPGDLQSDAGKRQECDFGHRTSCLHRKQCRPPIALSNFKKVARMSTEPDNF